MNSAEHRGILAFAGLILTVIAVIVYGQGLHGPFVFDDMSNIISPAALRITSLDPVTLWHAAFWQESSLLGRPLAMLSFALNFYFTQLDVYYFKLTNLAIHLLNGGLLYLLAVRLLARLPDTADRAHAAWLALIISGIWLVHPLNLTSVLYVVQRMTSLSAFFVLLGLLGYVLGRERMVQARPYGLTLSALSVAIGGTVAVLAKENGVLLPLYAIAVEAVFFRFAGDDKAVLRRLWLSLLALPLLALLVLAIAKPQVLAHVFSYTYRDFTLYERLMTESRALWFYLRLIVLPDVAAMGIYHDDFPVSHGLWAPPSTALALLGLVGLIAAAVVGYRRVPVLSFGIGWFLLGHTLESTALPLELVHEHRNYLPQFGILFALAYYLRYPWLHLQQSLRLRHALLLVYFALLAASTYSRSLDWTDEWTLYSRDVKTHPNSARAHTMLAIILHDNKLYPQALAHFLKAAELGPRDSSAIVRLAQHLYKSTGTVPEEVLRELEFRLRSYPYTGATLWTFEPLLKNTAADKALNVRLLKMYQALIEREDVLVGPRWRAIGYRTLGFAYRTLEEYDTALLYFRRAMEIEDRSGYHLVSAEIHLKKGDKIRASQELELVEADYLNLSNDDRARVERIRDTLNNQP